MYKDALTSVAALGSLSQNPTLRGTQEWCMAFLGSLAWVHCAEGGNSKQKSHEKGKTKKALRAVPASVGAEKRTGDRDPVTV